MIGYKPHLCNYNLITAGVLQLVCTQTAFQILCASDVGIDMAAYKWYPILHIRPMQQKCSVERVKKRLHMWVIQLDFSVWTESAWADWQFVCSSRVRIHQVPICLCVGGRSAKDCNYVIKFMFGMRFISWFSLIISQSWFYGGWRNAYVSFP